MQSIPASKIVSVNPSVLSAGGNPLALNGLILSEAAPLPIGAPLSFPSAKSVSDYFGPTSQEALMAATYFNGYVNGTQRPSALLFYRYAASPVAAFLRGGANQLTLAEIQAITAGALSVTIDGVVKSSTTINLSTATSFSNAAALITTALGLSGGAAVTYDSNFSAFVITSGTTGAASTITYASDTLATSLSLTQATGAVLSQGAAATTPAAAMGDITNATQNWAAFTTAFDPLLDDKKAFAAWTSGTDGRYLYACWDTDITATETPGSFTGLGNYVKVNNLGGTAPLWKDPLLAAFVLGCVASIDYVRTNGRITLAFRRSTSVLIQVTDETTADNLLANGYSYYGTYGTANDQDSFLYNGQVSGDYLWIDSYVNAIWLTNQFQLALVSLLQNSNTIPYSNQGFGLIKAALQDPINQALNAGVIRAGVTPSALQAAEANAAAGVDISQQLATRGWYLQVLDPGAQSRQNRTSPICNFWYMDGESVQQIALAATDIL